MSAATSRFIPATVHGHYLVAAPEDPGRLLLVGFHGYGEDAAMQLERLQRLPGAETAVLVSVQALHPFYRGRSEAVGASWMTRFDRERAIEDNIAYAGSVVRQAAAEHRTRGLVYAGFSQGVAMAFRAAARVGVPCDGVIACGGDVPPELRDAEATVWTGMRVLVGRGARDEWYTQEKLDADLELLRRGGAVVDAVVFDGGHEWNEAFSLAAGQVLAGVIAGRRHR